MALKLCARLWLHQATTEASVKTPQEMKLGVAISVVKNIDISISIDTEISERYQY